MILLEKETVYHPFEYLGLSHPPLTQKNRGHGPAAYGIKGCIIQIVNMFLSVCVYLRGNKRPDRPSGICAFAGKIGFLCFHFLSTVV